MINPATDTVTGTAAVGSGPSGVAVNPGGNVYVTNFASTTVSVIDPATNTVTAIDVGSSPFGVAVNPGGNIYVTNAGADTVSAIDPATNTVTTTDVGSFPRGWRSTRGTRSMSPTMTTERCR
ncbi:YncE family protein [Mycobacterium camsae]|uniref:YncE family protein n=1 Tax=Mycobacterium gordonae TaxID=1778 RepID=UPI003D66315C